MYALIALLQEQVAPQEAKTLDISTLLGNKFTSTSSWSPVTARVHTVWHNNTFKQYIHNCSVRWGKSLRSDVRTFHYEQKLTFIIISTCGRLISKLHFPSY